MSNFRFWPISEVITGQWNQNNLILFKAEVEDDQLNFTTEKLMLIVSSINLIDFIWKLTRSTIIG